MAALLDRYCRDSGSALPCSQIGSDAGGARIECADGNGNGDGAADVLMRRMLDAFAEFERAQISMRTRAALAVKRRRGERISGVAPFGFCFVGGVLEEVPGERALMERILSLRSRDLGPEAIARELNGAGMVNPRTGRGWSRQLVHKIVQTSGRVRAAS